MDEDSAKGWCKTTGLEKCTGDVTVQSRKQKKFPLYELEIKIKWEGQLWDENGKVATEAKGHVKIPDLSEETYDDLELTVVCDEETGAKRPLKEAMRTSGAKRIREACIKFVRELKESINTGDAAKNAAKKAPPPHILYETFLDANRIRGATASDCTMSAAVGGKFTMFSGSVEGENVTLEPFTEASGMAKIVWKWRFATWQPGHFSTVTLEFSKKDDGSTELNINQLGVPEEERG